jgi:hypothetical protein
MILTECGKELRMRDDDPEFQLCEAKALFDSLAAHLARKPPDEALTRMAGTLTKLIDDLSNLGKEPLPKAIKERQVKLFLECTSVSAEIRERVIAVERQLAEAQQTWQI